MFSKTKAFLIIAISLSFSLLLLIGTPAWGGEQGRLSYRDAYVAPSLPSAKVPDVEGHTIYLVDAKGIHFDEKWGVAFATVTGVSEYLKGGGPVQGYNHWAFADGSTITLKYKGEGKGVAPDAAGRRVGEGTFTFTQGTGKFQGIQGEGTYKWVTVAPGIWYTDGQAEYTLP